MPDGNTGVFMLILVNALIVFGVLGAISLIISLTRVFLSKAISHGPEEEPEVDPHVMIMTGSQSDEPFLDDLPLSLAYRDQMMVQEPVIGGIFERSGRKDIGTQEEIVLPRDELDEVKKTAIAAALGAYLSTEQNPSGSVFLRGITGCGAWGRLSRGYTMGTNRASLSRRGNKGGFTSCVDSR